MNQSVIDDRVSVLITRVSNRSDNASFSKTYSIRKTACGAWRRTRGGQLIIGTAPRERWAVGCGRRDVHKLLAETPLARKALRYYNFQQNFISYRHPSASFSFDD